MHCQLGVLLIVQYCVKLYRPCRKATPTGTAVRYSFLRNANTSLFHSVTPIQHFEFCMKVPSRCFGRIEINLSQLGVYGLLSILSCKHIISIYDELFSLLMLNNQLIPIFIKYYKPLHSYGNQTKLCVIKYVSYQ